MMKAFEDHPEVKKLVNTEALNSQSSRRFPLQQMILSMVLQLHFLVLNTAQNQSNQQDVKVRLRSHSVTFQKIVRKP